jgi:hypothetical protein
MFELIVDDLKALMFPMAIRSLPIAALDVVVRIPVTSRLLFASVEPVIVIELDNVMLP